MTIFVVTTSEDVDNGDVSGNDLSLREAIDLANASAGRDRIQFADDIDYVALEDALPTIVDDLRLVGGGHVTLDANADGDADPGTRAFSGQRRGIDIQGEGTEAVIDGLRVTGGALDEKSDGGGIRSGAGTHLRVVDSEILRNSAGDGRHHNFGGGIFAEGDCDIVRTRVEHNRGGEAGGGIAVLGDCRIVDSRIANNSAAFDGGGIYAQVNLTLRRTLVSGNDAGREEYGLGGGILVNGTLRAIKSQIVGNEVEYGWGGGVFSTGAVVAKNSVIADNRAIGGYDAGGSGGGIFSHTVRLINSEVSGNVGSGRATVGGGICADRVKLVSSAVVYNFSAGDYGRGGGIFADALIGRDSTIAWNYLRGFNNAYGGGAFAKRLMELDGVTVTGNRVTAYGSYSTAEGGAIATLKGHGTVRNSLLVGNRSDDGGPVAGAITLRSSLVDDDGRAIFADVTKIGKGLFGGDLGNNGGLTPTVALLWHRHNPAIGGADPDHATDRDQRGVARDNHPDLGSLEATRRAGVVLVGGEGTDILQGTEERDRLDAAGGNDELRGGGKRDVLDGGSGDDVLIGGRQGDLMRGGTGHDLFVMTPAFGRDTIEDFDARPANGQDRIDLRALGITAASFEQSVEIDDRGHYTWVTIGGSYIRCSGVDGKDGNVLTIDDFLLLA